MKPLKTPEDILDLIRKDAWMMNILRVAQSIGLPDWWLAAGFVRSKVWDYLHEYSKRTPLPDIDLVYFDPQDPNEETEKKYETRLKNIRSDIGWSVKNMARMHIVNEEPPYTSACEGISHWVETPTCIGVRISYENNLELCAPHGINDLVSLTVQPSPLFSRDKQIYYNRIKKKSWTTIWPKLIIK